MRIIITLLFTLLPFSASMAETLIVKVDGMECINCVMAIEETFGDQDGVTKAKADLESQTLILDLQDDTALSKDTIKHLLESGGYEFVDIQRTEG